MRGAVHPGHDAMGILALYGDSTDMNKADMETRCPRVSQEELDEALRKLRRDEWFMWVRLIVWIAILLGLVASIVWMFVRG